jgi:hypothetical protein
MDLRRLLCACDPRPRGGDAEERDAFAALHLVTSRLLVASPSLRT